MVLADEKQLQAIINTVKTIPVNCRNFDDADSWVGIVMELTQILGNRFIPESELNKDDIPTKVGGEDG